MKMFVWNDPYDLSCGGSILFAVAATVEDAKRIAGNAYLFRHGIIDLPAPMSSEELGEPDRVYNLPCAEWYEWSE